MASDVASDDGLELPVARRERAGIVAEAVGFCGWVDTGENWEIILKVFNYVVYLTDLRHQG